MSGAAEAIAAAFKGVPAIAVVARTQFRTGEDLVGLGSLLELLFGLFIARIAVRVVLHRELAIGLFDLAFGGIAGQSKNIVAVALLAHGNGRPVQSPGPEETTTCAARRSLSFSL